MAQSVRPENGEKGKTSEKENRLGRSERREAGKKSHQNR